MKSKKCAKVLRKSAFKSWAVRRAMIQHNEKAVLPYSRLFNFYCLINHLLILIQRDKIITHRSVPDMIGDA